MKRPLDRVFYYHASASPIGGRLTHPVEAVLDQHASVSLPQAGGQASARLDKFNLHNMIRCEAAYSHTVGSVQKSTGNWTTLVTSVVEGVNVFDIVKADRMVSTIAVEHHRSGYYPKASFLGSQFENLRIGDRDIKVDVHHQSLVHTAEPKASEWVAQEQIDVLKANPDWQGFPDRPWPANPVLTDWARSQSDTILSSSAPQEIKDRFSWVPDEAKRQQRGYVLCSLVDEVEGAVPGTNYGHVINVPDLGYLFLGELIVDPIGFRLAMMRVELGCIADGNVSMACAGGHSVPMP
jgi:hypothetical protein